MVQILIYLNAYTEVDRLQLSFNTGIIFPFACAWCARVIQRLASVSLSVFEKLVK